MRTLTVTEIGSIQTMTDASDRFVIKAPVDKTFDALTLALRDVGIEPTAVNGARDISAYGGWRAFMTEKAAV